MPPPRPVFDRSSFQAEREANPSLDARMQTIVQGEVGHGATPEEKKIQLEAIFNRAAARGQTLGQVTQQYTGPGSAGYYPATTFANGAARGPQESQDFQRDIMTPVLRGSDVGGQALGFPPTGNASGGVASRGIASGRYNEAGRLPGGAETYVQQESPAGVARLNASRLPTRNAIAQAMTPPPPVLAQGGDGGGPPPGTATDARQPPNLNPIITTDTIAPAPPVRTAQATEGPYTRPPLDPLDPSPAAPGVPSVGRVATPPFQVRRQPAPPNENDIPFNREQIRGQQLLMAAGTDPVKQAAAQRLITLGTQRRAADVAQRKAAYDAELSLYKPQQDKLLEHSLSADTREATLRELRN